MLRRDFLRGLLGAGIATAATPAIVEPVRRIWQVGAQLERVDVRAQRLNLCAGNELGPNRVVFSRPDGWPSYADQWDLLREPEPMRAPMVRRTREELAAMYPEPTDTLFGIEHGGFTEWLVARYTQTDAARLFRELTLSYANPEQASRFATRS